MENIIEIKNISFTYPSVDEKGAKALSDVSLAIKRGSFVAVVGRNGSGKSTLAKHMNALLLPDTGKVYVKGMDTSDETQVWNIRQCAGMVFQNPDNQLVASIVEEDVAFGPENLGLPRDEIISRVQSSLESVAMLEFAKRSPHMLSCGQKQRIAIAGVLALHPEIVIMDESTAMLDPLGRREVVKTAQQLHEEGITVVLITHFMEEAALADEIVVMDNGTVVMQGTPRQIFEAPETLAQYGLTAPPEQKLRHMLSPFYSLPQAADIDEMAELICRYVLKK